MPARQDAPAKEARVPGPYGSRRHGLARVVGVDPGGKETGIVARDGDQLLHALLVTRGPGVSGDGTDARYLTEVLSAVDEVQRACHAQLVAVEGLVAPTPHMRLISVKALLQTATVYGALLAARPDALVVPPGGHGKAPLRCYPPILVGDSEPRGAGWRRHLRSAWDIAGAATFLLGDQAATA